MSLTLEIIIIIIAGAASSAFLGWYFYRASKKPGKCHGCQAASMEELKKSIKQKQAKQEKPADSSHKVKDSNFK